MRHRQSTPPAATGGAGYHQHVFTLSRTVRFAISLAGDAPSGLDPADRDPNGYAGVPAFRGFAAHYELDVACTGEPDPVTGYLISIADIDRAVREQAVPRITDALRQHPGSHPAGLLPLLMDALGRTLHQPPALRLDHLLWRLSPFYSLSMNARNPETVVLRQRFEFAAAHRLHAPQLSDEENRRVYGKCNNPSGHGHNYVLEPAVRSPLTSGTPALDLPALERLVDAHVVKHFDHKHLNTDLSDFDHEVASVENIAKRCYELLAPSIKRSGGELESLTVWETEKTSCTYAPPSPKTQ